MEPPVHLEVMDSTANLVPPDHVDELEFPEPEDQQETQVIPVQWDHPEAVVEPRDQTPKTPSPQLKKLWEKPSLDQMEFFTISEEDHRVQKDQLDHQENQVHQDQPDLLDPLDQPVVPDQMATLVPLDHEVHQELMEQLEPQEFLERQVNQEPKDQQGPLV